MRVSVIRFEPSSKRGEFAVDLPAGSHVILARMSRMGEGELVVSHPEDSSGTEPRQFLALWEDMTPAGGGAKDWRHVGALIFNSGSWQHIFALPAERKGRQ